MTLKRNVLIPDGDSTWALSVIHCLSQIENYNLFVLSNTKRTASKYSRYTSYYKFHERPADDSWVEIINAEIELNKIDVILPIAEKEITFFIKHKQDIYKNTKIIPWPKLRDYEIAIDKYRLSNFAKEHEIPHPRSYFISSEIDLENKISGINFPLLIKPLHQKGGEGIIKVNSEESLIQHLKRAHNGLFIQDYIKGYDIDCSVLCQDGEVLVYTIQKGNLQGDTTFAPQLAFDFLQNEHLLATVKLIMNKLNWSGIAHLDMRYDEKANNYKLIEINARFWGSIEASKFAGVNFPHLVISLAMGEELPKIDYKSFHYMRLKGVIKTVRRNPLFVFKRSYLLNNTETKTFIKDPLPTFHRFRDWLVRRF
ncbi:ATP-grasp domain-containing protein [Psychroserpens sp. Hel_I_66]|uniref:carboxylate--amine ligase n=1 Tax=Psychroserpens sp. Hel_I_66 TaxID=1250004 RepID=UPI000645FDC1|nr:ATP-grasp domain-containing protein [Psychroserpens sp. Hel_I_66]